MKKRKTFAYSIKDSFKFCLPLGKHPCFLYPRIFNVITYISDQIILGIVKVSLASTHSVPIGWPSPSWQLKVSAKSLQSCQTVCDPIDSSPPGSPVPGILQARTLEWVAISFSNAWKWKVKVKSLSRVWPSATPWTAAFQAPLSMGFSRQEYWSGVPLPSPKVSRHH